MPTVPNRDPQPQDRAVEIVADALRILRTRDGLPITDEQILERARNVVAGLGDDFDLVPHPKTVRAAWRELRTRFDASLDGLDAIEADLAGGR